MRNVEDRFRISVLSTDNETIQQNDLIQEVMKKPHQSLSNTIEILKSEVSRLTAENIKLRDSADLNETLLSSLPHPAMYIRKKDRVVLAANKMAMDFGIKPGVHCWRTFGKTDHLSTKHEEIARQYPEIVPEDSGVKCHFCLGDHCFDENKEQNNPEIHAFGLIWDTYWIKITDEVFLEYAINITKRKNAEDLLKNSLEQLRDLSNYIEKVREEERVAISRELHDDLGQALTAVKIDLGLIRQSTTDNAVIQKINKVSNLVSETIKTVQHLTSQLRPEIIDDLGLEAAIDWYTHEYSERTNIQINLNIDSKIIISPEASLIIFRIMQESLTNIARHAKASRVDIHLAKNADHINLIISDNGIGITENDIKSKKSFGIINMKERSASLGGVLEISRGNIHGTLIKLDFPINTQ